MSKTATQRKIEFPKLRKKKAPRTKWTAEQRAYLEDRQVAYASEKEGDVSRTRVVEEAVRHVLTQWTWERPVDVAIVSITSI